VPPVSTDPVDVACERAALAMSAAGLPLVSVYLQAGGRLRCRAVHGYGQLFDGIGPGVGVIGQVWVSGRPREVRRVTADPAYLAAVWDVVAEVCAPVTCHGRTIGVLNAESTQPLPPGALDVVVRLAQELADELDVVGCEPGVTPAQRLMRHAAVLAEAGTADEVAQAFLAAATETAGLSSALLLLGDPLHPVAVRGALAGALRGLAPAALQQAADWVAAGGSSRTSTDPHGLVLAGQDALQQAGARSLVVVSVGTGDERLGVLVAADERLVPVESATVEELELLAALAAADLRSARLTDRLRRQAETDQLTGLGHRSAFSEALAQTLRQVGVGQRVGVLALDLDGFKQINDTGGHAAGDEVLRRTAAAMSGALREGDRLYRIGGDEFATVLVVHGDEEAVGIGDRVLRACRSEGAATVSVGVAVAGPDERPEQVLARADAAMYTTKRNGRDGLTLAQ